MAAAYAAIANDGQYHRPYYVERVLDRDGQLVFQHHDPGERVLTTATAPIAADLFKSNVEGGPGTAARVRGNDVVGYTRPAHHFSHDMFVGFPPPRLPAFITPLCRESCRDWGI